MVTWISSLLLCSTVFALSVADVSLENQMVLSSLENQSDVLFEQNIEPTFSDQTNDQGSGADGHSLVGVGLGEIEGETMGEIEGETIEGETVGEIEGETVGEAVGEAETRQQCPPGWRRYGDRCYLFVQIASPWAEAERHCVTLGGNMASVHSLAQYHFLQQLIRDHAHSNQRTWLGANDAIQEGIWLWSDGSRFNYRLWSSGNPDNHPRPLGQDNTNGREHCLEMNYQLSWNDAPCWFRFPFLCSRR
ncbi:galactose-specific lectin nattectin-like [Osmerus mordax]|uniref:galactose-specific lectin nattectin-like n=1 Tax=Osmerus mordax TaxID=8014 RepID=UPI00350FE136